MYCCKELEKKKNMIIKNQDQCEKNTRKIDAHKLRRYEWEHFCPCAFYLNLKNRERQLEERKGYKRPLTSAKDQAITLTHAPYH